MPVEHPRHSATTLWWHLGLALSLACDVDVGLDTARSQEGCDQPGVEGSITCVCLSIGMGRTTMRSR